MGNRYSLLLILFMWFNNDIVVQSMVTKLDPILDISGKGVALFLFDVHRDVLANGTCHSPLQPAQSMISTLEWISSILEKTENGNKTGIGLKVFDMCGSTERAINVLFHSVQCADTSEIKGVFVYSSTPIQRVVEAYAKPRNIPVHSFLDAPDSLGDNKEDVIPLYSTARTTAAKDLVMRLNWTYFTVHHTDNKRAKEDYTEWQRMMSSQASICETQSGLLDTGDDISTQIRTKPSKGALIFASGISLSTLKTTVESLKNMKKKSIIVTDISALEISSGNFQTDYTIVLSPFLPSSNQLKENLNETFTSYNLTAQLDFTDENTPCVHNATSSNSTCVTPISFTGSYGTYVLVESFFKLYIECLRNDTMNNSGTPFQLFDRTSNISVVTMSAPDGSTQADSESQRMKELSNVKCSGFCPECYLCNTSTVAKVNSAFIPGDLVLFGAFPVLKRGEKLYTCGPINVDGRADQLVYSFIYAITTVKTRYPYLLANVPIGYFVMDTCSTLEATTQNIMNFETCTASFRNAEKLIPPMVPAYIVQDDWDIIESTVGILNRIRKVSVTSSEANELQAMDFAYDSSASVYDVLGAVVEILITLSWKSVIVVSSTDNKQQQNSVDSFLNLTKEQSICVYDVVTYNPTLNSTQTFESIRIQRQSAIVMFTTQDETKHFFKNMPYSLKSRMFIICSSVLEKRITNPPLGSITFKLGLEGSSNTNGFQNFYSAIDPTTSNLPWVTTLKWPTSDLAGRIPSYIVRSVDIALHALNDLYLRECPEQQGICSNFRDKLIEEPSFSAQNLKNVKFTDVNEVVNLRDRKSGVALTIESYQDTSVKVGTWNGGKLDLDVTKIKAYTASGLALSEVPTYICTGNCKCVNYDTNNTDDDTYTDDSPPLWNSEYKYFTTQDKFIGTKTIWATVVITIGCVGAFVTFVIIIYVLYKLCTGAIVKRHVGMGILLLITLIFLYLSVLPFTFTPSENVCAFQFLAPGIAYAFVFAVLLVKMMTLREYKLIGLGGEVSSINQFLTVVLAGGVQIAVNVQWWVMSDSLVHTVIVDSEEQYACKFDRVEFIAYLSYVIALIVLNTLYSFGVRNEQRTTGDARYLVASMICSILVWIAWVVVMFVLNRDFTEPTIAIGMLTCATLILLIMFIPKIHMLASMQYDVKQKGGDDNGYKIDSDFMYERPYSLPGTLKTSYSDSKPFSKTMFNFDDNLSY